MSNASDSVRYEEAGMVKPKNSRSGSGTGSVIDPRSKYPSTIEFASGEAENKANVEHGRHARRPGGHYREGHGFHTPNCTCGKHPCTCGNEEAKKHVIHCNIQE